MKPKRIILVRHGESEANVDKNLYAKLPDHEIVLTKTGEQQALAAGGEIAALIGTETVQAYVSPFKRTRQTYAGIAEGIGHNVVDVWEDPRIREQEFGHWSMRDNREEVMQERREYGRFYYRLPDGESSADVYDRMSTFLESLHRAFERPDFAENCLIVSHGAALRVFMMRWYRLTVEEFLDLRNPFNCQLIVMEKRDDGTYEPVRGLGTKSGKESRV